MILRLVCPVHPDKRIELYVAGEAWCSCGKSMVPAKAIHTAQSPRV